MHHHNSHQCPYCRAHLSPRELHQCQHVEKRITSATRTLQQQLQVTPTWDPSLIKAFQKLEREKEKEVQLSKLRRPLPSSPFSAPSPSSSASSISPLPFSPSLSSASTAKSSLQCPYCGEPCVPNLMHYCTHIEPLVTPRSNQPSPETVVFNKKQTYIKSVKKAAEKLPTTTARNSCPALFASADDGETNDSLIPLKKQCFQLSDIVVNDDDDDDDDHPMMVVETEFQSSTAAAAVSGTAVIRTTTTTNKARKKRKREKEQQHKITRLYRCDFCPKNDFVDFAQYMGHRLVHISERPHQCNQCSSAFARRSTLIRHIKELHSFSFSSSHSPATFTAIFQTPNQCQQQQQQQQSDLETESKPEPENKPTAIEPKDLKQTEPHSQTENNTTTSEQRWRPYLYRCDLCPNEYATKSWLYKHLSLEHIDHGEHRYRCDHCQEGFSTKGDLQGHLRAFKGQHSWRFKCETCQKRFQWMHTLKFHRKVHHPW